MRTLLLLTFLLLAGCTTPPIQVTTNEIDKSDITLPKVDRIYPRDIKWIIVTPENVEEVFNELKKTGRPIAVFGLTGDDYENLTLNVADERKLLIQLKAVIKAYEDYYKSKKPQKQ